MAKLVVEKEGGKILGAHIIGPHATDLVAQMTLAVKQGMTVDNVAHTIHAHPTLSEIFGELSMQACGMAIHN